MVGSIKEFTITALIVVVTTTLLFNPQPIISTVYFLLASVLLIYIGVKAIKTKKARLWRRGENKTLNRTGGEAIYIGYFYTIVGIIVMILTFIISDEI